MLKSAQETKKQISILNELYAIQKLLVVEIPECGTPIREILDKTDKLIDRLENEMLPEKEFTLTELTYDEAIRRFTIEDREVFILNDDGSESAIENLEEIVDDGNTSYGKDCD